LSCDPCSDGFYSNATSGFVCTACTAGTSSSTAHSTCVPCNDGYFSIFVHSMRHRHRTNSRPVFMCSVLRRVLLERHVGTRVHCMSGRVIVVRGSRFVCRMRDWVHYMRHRYSTDSRCYYVGQ
jgi:hypothetical protein